MARVGQTRGNYSHMYVVRMCGRWEGRAVSIYTTYADPIKAKEGSKKQTTNNF